MDLKQLKYFVYIAELRSISLASAALHVAQPALTRRLHNLELEIGTKLVERHSRGVSPTPAGMALLDHARRILADVDEIKPLAIKSAGYLAGNVCLGLPIPITPILATRLLLRSASEYPNISLRIVEGFSTLIHEWLSSGSVTLAMLYGASSKRTLNSLPLVIEDLYVVGNNSPQNKSVAFYTPRDLAKMPLILPHEPHPIFDALNVAGVNVRECIHADALGIMKDLAESGTGYSVLPLSAVGRDVDSGRLTAAPIKNPSIRQHVCLCHSSLRRLTPASEHVYRLVVEEVGAAVSDGRWPGGALFA